jgi:hypothetical protein
MPSFTRTAWYRFDGTEESVRINFDANALDTTHIFVLDPSQERDPSKSQFELTTLEIADERLKIRRVGYGTTSVAYSGVTIWSVTSPDCEPLDGFPTPVGPIAHVVGMNHAADHRAAIVCTATVLPGSMDKEGKAKTVVRIFSVVPLIATLWARLQGHEPTPCVTTTGKTNAKIVPVNYNSLDLFGPFDRQRQERWEGSVE